MNKQIALIISNKIVAQSAKRIMEKLGVDYPIYADNYTRQDVLDIAKECIKNGAKVIITRGETAARLRSTFDVHVVDIR